MSSVFVVNCDTDLFFAKQSMDETRFRSAWKIKTCFSNSNKSLFIRHLAVGFRVFASDDLLVFFLSLELVLLPKVNNEAGERPFKRKNKEICVWLLLQSGVEEYCKWHANRTLRPPLKSNVNKSLGSSTRCKQLNTISPFSYLSANRESLCPHRFLFDVLLYQEDERFLNSFLKFKVAGLVSNWKICSTCYHIRRNFVWGF